MSTIPQNQQDEFASILERMNETSDTHRRFIHGPVNTVVPTDSGGIKTLKTLEAQVDDLGNELGATFEELAAHIDTLAVS